MKIFSSICASILIITSTSNGEVRKVFQPRIESRFRITFTNSHRRKRFFRIESPKSDKSIVQNLARDRNQVRMGWHIPGRFARRGWRSKSRNPEFDFRPCSLNETPTYRSRDEGPSRSFEIGKCLGLRKKKELRRIAYRGQMAGGSLLAKPTTFVHVAPPPLSLLCERMLRAWWSVHGRW